jgi:hypothetical protein
MRSKSLLLVLGLFVLLLSSGAASGQGRRDYYGPPRGYYGPSRGYYGPPRGYYGPPRGYYAPPPLAYYGPPRVVVVPAPYCAPRPRYYGYHRGRRW